MPTKTKLTKREQEQQHEIEELRTRLAEAEETLRAIREGEVDALIVSGTRGEQVFSLVGTESIYRLIVETMKEAAFTVTFDGTVLYANAQFGELLGRPIEQIVGHPLTDFLAEDSASLAPSILKAAKHAPIKRRMVFRAMDDKPVPTHISANVLNQPDGMSICVVASDLTELENSTELIQQLRRQQAALQDSENRWKAVFDASPDCILLIDNEGRYLEANPATAALFTVPPGELVGRHISEFITAEFDLPRVWADFREKRCLQQEFKLRRPDGTVFLAETRAIADILPGRHLAILRDISDRKRYEEALRRSEERFRVAQELSPDGFIIFRPERDETGRIVDFTWVYQNATVARMNHTESLNVIGRRLLEVIPSHVNSPFHRVYQEVAESGKPAVLEAPFQGDTITEWTWFRVAVVPIGEDIAVLVQNMTERRKMEESLREATEDLERSNQDLQQFAYVASHDLQEPLRAVSSFLQLLEGRYKAQLDDTARQYIGFAVDGATRMSTLIRDLLEYSRIESKGQEPAPTDSADALQAALANLKSAIEEAGAAVEYQGLPTIDADRTQLMQLFQNLIGNAIKFRSPDRECKIEIGATRADGYWQFFVKDNGIGIDPKHQDRIFVIFQRLHGRDKYAGTGIGLAVCKKIVERHGGRIWMESEQGQGTTFFFTMPEPQSHEQRSSD